MSTRRIESSTVLLLTPAHVPYMLKSYDAVALWILAVGEVGRW